MFYLNENLFFDLYLDGRQLQVGIHNIEGLNITCNIFNSLPALRMTILDDRNLFDGGALNAGSVLTLKVGESQEAAAENGMEFVIQGVPQQKDNGNLKLYTLYAVLNNLRYQKCVEPIFYKGTSSNALKYVCDKCDLLYDGVYTNDDMVWCNGTKDYASFVSHIVNHGYKDSYSCMVSAVVLGDKKGKLVYKDVQDIRPKYTFSNTTRDSITFQFVQNSFENKSGLYNLEYGYKNQFCQYGLEENRLVDELTFHKIDSSVLNLSKTTLDETGYIRNKVLPPDVGNYHKNWLKAEYQNIRIKSLYSVYQEFLFNYRVNEVDVLDKIKFAYIDPQTKMPDTVKATEWVVIGKVLAISGGRYYEKFLTATTGQNSALFGNLV